MNEECLICKAPLRYLEAGTEMECMLCHKKELSKTACRQGHYVCDSCHSGGMGQILSLCLDSPAKNPAHLLEELMALPTCHMHGPEHHVMVGAALLTAYRNAGGTLDLPAALTEMLHRGKQVPGGACGYWGACGAGLSTGMYISIATKATPLSSEVWGLANRMTARALDAIGRNGGPRCCKRDSFLAVTEAVGFTREHLGVSMEQTPIACAYSRRNNQCRRENCPFFQQAGAIT